MLYQTSVTAKYSQLHVPRGPADILASAMIPRAFNTMGDLLQFSVIHDWEIWRLSLDFFDDDGGFVTGGCWLPEYWYYSRLWLRRDYALNCWYFMEALHVYPMKNSGPGLDIAACGAQYFQIYRDTSGVWWPDWEFRGLAADLRNCKEYLPLKEI